MPISSKGDCFESRALSKKIAVIQFLPFSQVDWACYRRDLTDSDTSEFDSPFLNQEYIGYHRYFYGCAGNYMYVSLHALLKAFFNRNKFGVQTKS